MSFDLAVWSDVRLDLLNEKAALEIYHALCEEETSSLRPAADAKSRIASFVSELNAKYPAIGAFADEDMDACVWSADFEMSEAHVLMNMSFSRADEVAPFVVMLAGKYRLVVFDPQIGATRRSNAEVETNWAASFRRGFRR